jgi:hypothetical protein
VDHAHPEDLKTPDSNPLKRWEKLPPASDHPSGTSKRGRGNQAGLAEAEVQDSTNEDDVFIEELAEMSEHRHPLDVINEYLLKEVRANEFGFASRSMLCSFPRLASP